MNSIGPVDERLYVTVEGMPMRKISLIRAGSNLNTVKSGTTMVFPDMKQRTTNTTGTMK